MIKWLNQKYINWDRVKELLEMSALKNWYTNFGPVSSLLEERIYSNLDIVPSGSYMVCHLPS